MSKSYTPRAGSLVDLAEQYLTAHPDGVMNDDLAAAIGTEAKSMSAGIAVGVKHGLFHRVRVITDGKSRAQWWPGPGPDVEATDSDAAPDEPQPFVCALWCDGDLTLRVNGADVWLAKADADALRRYLAQFPTPSPEPEAQPA